MIFIDNKYTKYYNDIIKNAQERHLPEDVYVEKHHIIPRSLGGSDRADNLVVLTAREHFVCHLLLTKMTSGNHKYKAAFASRMMLGTYSPKSRIYAYVKELANAASKELWNDPSFRDKIIEERKIRCSDSKVKQQMSDRMKEVWLRPEYVKKHQEAMKKVHSDTKWLERNRQAQTEAWQDPVKRENRLKNRKPPTAEATESRSKHTSASNKTRWADPEYKARVSKAIKEAKAKKKAAKEAALDATSKS